MWLKTINQKQTMLDALVNNLNKMKANNLIALYEVTDYEDAIRFDLYLKRDGGESIFMRFGNGCVYELNNLKFRTFSHLRKHLNQICILGVWTEAKKSKNGRKKKPSEEKEIIFHEDWYDR